MTEEQPSLAETTTPLLITKFIQCTQRYRRPLELLMLLLMCILVYLQSTSVLGWMVG